MITLRQRVLCAVAIGCTVVGLCFVAAASPAGAAQTRQFTGTSFGPAGASNPTSFGKLQSVGVSSADGTIYAFDISEGGKLYKFNASGTPVNFSALGAPVIEGVGGSAGEIGGETNSENQIAVAPPGSPAGTAGDIYVANNTSALSIYAASGEKLGEIEIGEETCGVATDAAGHIFVGSYPSTVREFTPSSNPPILADKSAESTGVLSELCNVAADGTGRIYATTYQGNQTYALATISATTAASIEPPGRAIAVEQSTNELFVGNDAAITVFTPLSVPNGEFTSSGYGDPHGIAFNGTSTAAYVGSAETGRVLIFGPPLPTPDVATGAASGVTATSATLSGTIGPAGGLDATCFFQYVGRATFAEDGFNGASTAPCAPSGPFAEGPRSVSAAIAGLFGGTEYRFRLVGQNANGRTSSAPGSFTTISGVAPSGPSAAACPNEPFRNGPSFRLPDCRAFEQVTGTEKNGGNVGGWPDYVLAAESGGAVTFYTQAGVPGGAGAQNFPSFLARRNSDWTTQGTLPPASLGQGAFILGYSPDLHYVVSQVTRLGVGTSLVIEDTVTRGVTPVVPYVAGTNANGHYFALDRVTNNGSMVYFESNLPLTGETPNGQVNLYRWDRESNSVVLAGIRPAGTPLPGGAFGGAWNWASGDIETGGAMLSYYVAAANAVSTTGGRAYFTAAGSGDIYLRTEGVHATVVKVNETHKTNGAGPGGADPLGPLPAIFSEATPSGSRAYFMSHEQLTNNANTGAEDLGMDLYSYNAANGELTDVVASTQTETPSGAEVQGVLGISQDGAVVYFAANGVLAPGASPGHCDNAAPLGGNGLTCNLYRYDDSDGAGDITFIARLDGTGGLFQYRLNDTSNWSPASRSGTGEVTAKTARVSSDGSVLLFSSVRSLTGYDNRSSSCGNGSEDARCKEIYRYSAVTGRVTCVSCDPSGSTPINEPAMASEFVNAPLGDGSVRAAVLTRSLSANGSRVFFQTPDPLVRADSNGVGDVYEWEANGSSSCPGESGSGGCVYLLSTGQSPQSSYFADADSAGTNVFLFTESRLVPADRDQLFDIYDARELGGLADQNEVLGHGCSDEACQGPPTPAPPSATPGTGLFGPANQTPRRPKHPPKKCKKKRSCHRGKKCEKKGKCKKSGRGRAGRESAGGSMGGNK